MAKLVKSTDSRKPSVMKALKEASGGSKITQVKDQGGGTFTGQCFKHLGNRKYEDLGTFTVEVESAENDSYNTAV